jgi:hypothetical protein
MGDGFLVWKVEQKHLASAEEEEDTASASAAETYAAAAAARSQIFFVASFHAKQLWCFPFLEGMLQCHGKGRGKKQSGGVHCRKGWGRRYYFIKNQSGGRCRRGWQWSWILG